MNHSLPATLCLLLALVVAPAAATGTRELQVATLRTAAVASGSSSGGNESTALTDLNEALAREVCRRLSARCALQSLPFADVIPGVESGRFQLGVANVLRTPEREERVAFSSILWRSSSRLIGTTQSIGKYRQENSGEVHPQSLRKVRVAVQQGSQQRLFVSRLPPGQSLTMIETATTREALQKVLDGHADFTLMPVISAYFMLLQQAPGTAEFVGPALTEQGLGGTVHMILPKSEQTLRSEVDAALDSMRNDGTFQRIIRRYMPFLID